MTDTQNCPLCFNSTTTDSAVEEYNRQVRRDENKHLLAQIEALKNQVKTFNARWSDANKLYKELESELAAAKRDAAAAWEHAHGFRHLYGRAWHGLGTGLEPLQVELSADALKLITNDGKGWDAAIEQGKITT